MIKLIASDLDGTLLLNKAQTLPEDLFPLIRALNELGIRFVAASGRQYPNMKRLFAPVASDISFICENGALAVEMGQVLYQDRFDKELANEILTAIIEKKTQNSPVLLRIIIISCQKQKAFAIIWWIW